MRFRILCLAALLAGCAAPQPASNNSPAQARLQEAEARAAAAARSGDHAAAARHYDHALRIATSLENADAVAANAINLSIVDQWLGRNAEARAALAAVLDDPRSAFSERRRMQAELRRAILELADGNAGAAAVWAGQAGARCRESCEFAAAILNVQAQVELDSGRAPEAARLAERAAARGSRAEAANALRTLGRARQAQGEPAKAIEPLSQALAIDRELGDPRKILADLNELARAADAAGDGRAAREYRQRGLAVSRAVNDARSSAEFEALLRR